MRLTPRLCLHKRKEKEVPPVTVVPPSEGHPIQQWLRQQLTKHSLLHMCRTLHSISFSSPLQCIRLRSFIYLFIYLPACGPKGWWNSKWSAIYVGIMIWKWYSRATVLLRRRPYWIDNEWLAAEGIDCPEWFAFSSQARSVTSQARPYLRAVSRSEREPVTHKPWQESVHLNRKMSFSDPFCFIALRFHRTLVVRLLLLLLVCFCAKFQFR